MQNSNKISFNPIVNILCLLVTFTLLSGCQEKTLHTVDLETIKNEAQKHTPEMASFLSELITYKSIEQANQPLLPETKALMEKIFRKAESMGFTTRTAADGLVGILEYGQGEEVVGVVAHLDIVAAGDESQWQHPPYEGKIVDDVIWGRGAQDDRAGVVGTMWAAKILIDNDSTFSRKLRIILTTKEETGFGAATKYFAEEEPPTYGIVPDAIYIIRAENGYLDAKYLFETLTAEESENTITHWQGGNAVNSIPDRSIAVLYASSVDTARQQILDAAQYVQQNFPPKSKDCTEASGNECSADIKVYDLNAFNQEFPNQITTPPLNGNLVIVAHGIAGHSSTPEKGRNAIVDLALVLNRLTLTKNHYAKAAEFVAGNIAMNTDGSNFQLNTEKSIAEAADTTACLSVIEQNTNGIAFNINYRTGIANTNQEILQKSGNAVAQFGGSVSAAQPMFDAYYYQADDPLLKAAQQSFKTVTGVDAPLIPIAATTQVKSAPNLIAYGPVEASTDGVHFHSVNERMPVSSLTRNAVLYAHFLQELIQSPVSLARE
ncbi:M20/M25/M40 family metallo-hydrolase [Teredinibacter sp. KSP-S5-2]|uniref:M20/M25/M40 family metallo-hydrolase n=1 Tax=Teredinibacter sp. KSP-S5-2 TaxID=3034506 RepID=UPI002934FEA3|nr:M20/M25/M40 family metallo-hydrolase [Teredinibacter sp. KSP-S5-2]WNO08696.1 M20/M25/M40 family metallo-hydrolase [Teredinibacter sp. KSP-S5-2]